MENDPFGEKRDQKNQFANPIMPEVCPILAVEVYFLLCDLGNNKTAPFFPGL
jgi:hypothetical protein